MEALLEKEGDVENWNDERMDELSRRMDAGFEKTATKEEMNLRFDGMQKEMNRRFDEVDRRFGEFGKRFDKIDDRFDRLNNTLYVGLFGLIAAVIANGIWG